MNQAIGPLIRFSRKYNYFQYKWEMICIYALTFFVPAEYILNAIGL